jgi:O-antigen/teichoic acid export membrane protein
MRRNGAVRKRPTGLIGLWTVLFLSIGLVAISAVLDASQLPGWHLPGLVAAAVALSCEAIVVTRFPRRRVKTRKRRQIGAILVLGLALIDLFLTFIIYENAPHHGGPDLAGLLLGACLFLGLLAFSVAAILNWPAKFTAIQA